jgi:lactoylglutathione lyase
MIRSFFKLFLPARDLARSVPFYQSLGLDLAAFRTAARSHVYAPVGDAVVDPTWTRAVFWIDRARTHCLILSLAAAEQPWRRQHVAFDVDLADLRRAQAWLAERGTAPLPDLGKPPLEPVVHNWIPAASLLFPDPDGHQLELSARLPGAPIPEQHLPDAAEPLYLSEWERLRARLDRA